MTLRIGVLAASVVSATTELASWEATPTRSIVGSIGDASGFDCSATSSTGGDWCTGDTLVGRYWVAFTVNDIHAPPDRDPPPRTL
jgi:hypothetical protein